jgi:hypothetical protein
LLTALAKYHAITLVMRLYESIADRFYDKVTLDKLTMDTFYAAQKLTGKDQFESSIRTTSKASTNSKSNMEIASNMFQTTMWANVIAFLSDYSVHQVILCYGYFIYIRERRKRMKQQQEQGEGLPPTPRRQQQDEEDDRLMDQGAILASFLKKSTRLLVSRGVGLVFGSCGSAVGTIVWPGWGTLLFANLGEGTVGTLLDESSGKDSI